MQNHPDDDDGPQPGRSRRTRVIGIVVALAVAAIVVLHLTGIVGPGRSPFAAAGAVASPPDQQPTARP